MAQFQVSLNKTVITFLLVFITDISFSQNFVGGFTGGITTSQVDGDENDGFHHLGMYGGLFVDYQRTALQPIAPRFELQFSQKGAVSANKDFKTNIGYIDANFILRAFPHAVFVKIPEQFNLQVGTGFSTKVYESIVLNDVKNKATDFKRIDWQVCGGFEYDFEPIALYIGTSYSVLPNNERYHNFVLYFGLKVFCGK